MVSILIHWYVYIDFRNGLAECTCYARWFNRSANHNHRASLDIRNLPIGDVHFGLWFGPQSFMFYVAHHTHDGSPILIAKPHSLADGVLLIPPGPRHRGVDSDNERTILGITGLEAAASQNWNTNGFEIACTDWPIIRLIENARRLCRTSFDIE